MAGNIAPKVVLDGLLMYLDAANTKSYISGSTTWNTLSKGSINGTLINGPTFSSANGGSIVFDAIDDYVRIGTCSNWYPMSTSAFTFDAWVKSPGLGSGNTVNGIICLGYGLPLDMTSAGNIQLGVYDVITSGSSYVISANVNTLDNKWHHIVSTNDGLTSKIYIDGVFNTSRSAPFYGDIKSTWYSSTCGVGIDANDTSKTRFNGNISIVKVYNKALSAQEVLQNYNATKSRFSYITDAVSYLTGLVGYYSFNSNTNDLSGKGYDGTVVGSPTYTTAKVSNGINFANDVNLNYVDIPDNSDFSFTNGTNDLPFTLSVWVNITAFSAYGVWIINKRGGTSGTDEWQLISNASGNLIFYKFQYDSNASYQLITTSITLSTNTWYHIAITDAGTANINDCKIYVDGSLASVTRTTTGTYTRMNNGTGITRIGMSAWVTNPDLKHRGITDELAIWKNRELTATEVLGLYTKGNSGTPII